VTVHTCWTGHWKRHSGHSRNTALRGLALASFRRHTFFEHIVRVLRLPFRHFSLITHNIRVAQHYSPPARPGLAANSTCVRRLATKRSASGPDPSGLALYNRATPKPCLACRSHEDHLPESHITLIASAVTETITCETNDFIHHDTLHRLRL
jgi:hypothetical protein